MHPPDELVKRQIKFIEHAKSQSKLKLAEDKVIGRVTRENFIKKHGYDYVCPRCEHIAYGSPEGARCSHCGWYGKTITVIDYYKAKLFL